MFKPGDKVVNKDGSRFSNGEKVLTVERVDETGIWLEETNTWVRATHIQHQDPQHNLLAELQMLRERVAELESVVEAQVPPKWPQDNDDYWCVNATGEALDRIWFADEFDQACLSIGNVFRTKAEAEAEVQKRKVLAKLHQYTKGHKPDGKEFWVLEGCALTGDFQPDNYCAISTLGQITFPTREAAQAAIDNISPEELKLLF